MPSQRMLWMKGNLHKIKLGTAQCAVCEKDHHDIEDCPTFLIQPVQDRSKIIFRKKLCYGCLASISKDHYVKKCSNINHASCAMEDIPPFWLM